MGHPAHYYNVINLANALASEGHEILFIVREKDVLLDLLKDCNFKTILLGRKKSNSQSIHWEKLGSNIIKSFLFMD